MQNQHFPLTTKVSVDIENRVGSTGMFMKKKF